MLERQQIGWVVLKNGEPVRTAATSPMHKSAKLYSKEANAKAVATQNGGEVLPAFVEVPKERPAYDPRCCHKTVLSRCKGCPYE